MKNTVWTFLRNIVLNCEALLFKNKKHKDVLFVILNELMFSYARPILEKLQNDKKIRLHFCFYEPHRFYEGNLSKIIHQYHLKCIPYKIAKISKWDLIMFPYHGPYFRKDCTKIYIGHGLNSGKFEKGEYLKYGPDSRDENGDILYEKIFACDQSEKDMTKEYFPEHFSKVRVMGNLLLDELLHTQSNKGKIFKESGLDSNRKTLLVTSTWGPFSFAQNLGVAFFTKIEDYLKDYNVIISFHQNNFIDKHSPEINWPEIFDRTQHKNLHILRKNETTVEFLPEADMLLTDHTSVSLYYLFLGRPIIFYENPQVRFEKSALIFTLKEIAYTIQDVQALKNDIDNASQQFDKQKIIHASSKVCDHVNQAWSRYEEEIYETLGLNI